MNSSETKICQNCKNQFVVDPEDFAFYEKIKVPPPTFCPECRLVRRLLFRNERILYRRNCDLCGKSIISRYKLGLPFPVYCISCWYSDSWDPLSYKQEYNFAKPFFLQLRELSNKVPRAALHQTNAVNSEYANQSLHVKNVHLSTSVLNSEYIYYSYRIDKSRDSSDCAYGQGIERCYEITDVIDGSNLKFSRYVWDSLDSAFLYDARNCSDCLGCVNIRNSKYKIFNKQYPPEEYQNVMKKYDLGSYKILQEVKTRFEVLKIIYPKRFAMLNKTVNVTGDNLRNAKNSKICFDSYNLEDSRYVLAAIDGVKDSYDIAYSGLGCELAYEVWSAMGQDNKFSIGPYGKDMQYSEFCVNRNSSNLFGCISIPSQKQYCILNKQYAKEEYEELVPKIIQHMNSMPYTDKLGRVYRYGEFFPPESSPFSYNETIAQEYFPLTKEEAGKQGYSWKDPEERNYQVTMTNDQITDHIKDVKDSILNEIIQCAHQGQCNEPCTSAFKIIPQEFDFYRKMNLPLPRLCPNCRHYQRLKQRNPLKLWHRICQCAGATSSNRVYTNQTTHFHKDQPCPNEFETSYAPERMEIVYCENCYNSEVV